MSRTYFEIICSRLLIKNWFLSPQVYRKIILELRNIFQQSLCSSFGFISPRDSALLHSCLLDTCNTMIELMFPPHYIHCRPFTSFSVPVELLTWIIIHFKCSWRFQSLGWLFFFIEFNKYWNNREKFKFE